MQKFCHQCGALLQEGYKFCEKCGARNEPGIGTVPEPIAPVAGSTNKKIRWGWVFRSMGLILLSSIGTIMVFGIILALSGNKMSDENIGFLGIFAMIVALFLGSLWSAYISPGRTVKEPAIAITIIVVVVNLATGSFAGAILGWIVPWFIALIGAKLGEKMQARKFS